MLLTGKVVVVTGGSRGIGRAIALGCATEGASIVINHAHDPLVPPGTPSPAQATVDAIRSKGGQAIAVEGDVADPATAHALVQAAIDTYGSIDVCVANAGICPFHDFLDVNPDLLQRTMGVNFEGTFYISQAAACRMKEQGHGGSIIAISSISKLVGGEFQSHYTPTKAAQHALMQSAAIALGRYGIRCNSVLPGTIATDINRDDLTPEKIEYFTHRIPLGRIGQPEDVVGSVIFLASDMARYITGAELLVDGGLYVNLQ